MKITAMKCKLDHDEECTTETKVGVLSSDNGQTKNLFKSVSEKSYEEIKKHIFKITCVCMILFWYFLEFFLTNYYNKGCWR